MRGLSLPKPVYRSHHYTLYELTPGYISRDNLTHHNSHGLRGPEIAMPKPEGLVRVACMGESTTYCVGISDDRLTYPARLEHHLVARYPGRRIEVCNAGVGGYTSAENLLHFIFRVQPLQPDLVILYFTHNDVHPRRLPTLSRDYREYSKVWSEPRLLAVARAALRSETSIGSKVRRLNEYRGRMPSVNVTRNGPGHFADNVRGLAILARGWGIRLLVVLPPYRNLDGRADPTVENPVSRAVHEHRTIATTIATEHGGYVHDLARDLPPSPYSRQTPYGGEFYLDAVHFNERGAERMAEVLADVIAARGLIA